MKHKHKKVLLTNFLSLSSVQVANYILSLITVPYLVRILGADKFGLLAFAQAFIQYFVLLTDYGFNLSAVREASINRSDSNKLNQVFSAVLFIKFSLMLLSFILMLLIVFAFERFRDEWLVYFFTFGMVLGSVLFPVWFFQGIESMKQIAVLDLLSKVIFTVSIFVFVRERGDYIYVPLINSLGVITSGVVGFWLAVGKFGVKVIMPKMEEVKRQLKEGWYVFISTVAISLYTTSNTFILGIFTNDRIVGYYNAGERIVKAAQGILAPFFQSIYPHISKLASESREIAITFIRRTVKFVSIPTFLISCLLFVFAPYISDIVLGKEFEESIIVIRILAFLPFIIGTATVFANFLLLGFGYVGIWSAIIISASLFSITGAVCFVYLLKLNYIGISINVLLTEIVVLLLSWMASVKLTK